MSSYTDITMTNFARMHALIWALIYGGLLALVVSYFTRPASAALANWLVGAGAIAVIAGIAVLLYRATLKDEQ
jgi:hypothetical protein